MITTTLQPSTETETKIKYPVLAKRIGHNYVVLFTKEREGVVLHTPLRTPSLGRISDCWVSVTDSQTWEILPKGTQLILEQD